MRRGDCPGRPVFFGDVMNARVLRIALAITFGGTLGLALAALFRSPPLGMALAVLVAAAMGILEAVRR